MDHSKISQSGDSSVPNSPCNQQDFKTSISDCYNSIKENNKKIYSHCIEIQNKIHSVLNEYLNKFEKYKERFSEYNAEIEKLKAEELHLKSDKQDKIEECEKAKQQLDEYHENMHNILQLTESLEAKINIEEEKTKEYEQLLVTQQSNDEKIVEFDKAINYFQSRLGLKLKSKEDLGLSFIFTHINPDNQDEQFEFCIKIIDNDEYSVTLCQPEIPEAKLLLEKLNETNDLKSFVAAVREKFKEQISKESQHTS
ncbi:kinetochore protein Spc25-like isoform X2 [Centruroides vittatus]|uniref:kinetochore protein Spc25-like isoform X2 n=1 Tax=Centruroides vittatus TaxID=120091 RepID=UPI00350F313F